VRSLEALLLLLLGATTACHGANDGCADENAGGPVVLVSNRIYPSVVAAGSTMVYFVDGAGVIAVPKCGGAPSTLYSGPAVGLAVDSQSVYWSDSEGVESVPQSGGTPTTVISLPQFSQPWHAGAIAIDSDSVYYAASGLDPRSAAASSGVFRVPKSGGMPVTLAVSLPVGVPLVAVDETSVYWAVVGYSPGPVLAILRVAKTGGSPVTLASMNYVPMPSPAIGLAVDSTSVYWSDSGDGTVLSVPKGGGAPKTLASAPNAGALAVDSTGIYFLAERFDQDGGANGTVLRVPLAGGKPTTLISSGLVSPTAIAIDSNSIYVTDALGSSRDAGNTGTVTKLRKP
jgi:hypothetical protein